MKRMGSMIPPEGEVRFLTITDRQYGRIAVFTGKKRQLAPLSPSQLEFF
ncbi:putative cytosolic protein [Granulibacter bethesdensis]|uniref:Cytosolic protein n=1 Tax=Granulibacter bethesdensis TaxID=364410 RepID=A0AAN0RED2_9PROT|nr:putative cytosolic protein [Granulibacter bethesdensis]